MGFYYAANTDNRISYDQVLENIVYNGARSKGYEISVEKIGKREYDFILCGGDRNYSYVQVSMTLMADRKTDRNTLYQDF